MILPGAGGQQNRGQPLYDASGSITTGGTAQLLLPRALSRSSLIIENISDTNMFVDFGSARATATISSGQVNAVSVANAGFGFSVAPMVVFYGGAYTDPKMITPTYSIAGLPGYPNPSNPNVADPGRPAKATCVMTGTAPNLSVSSISIDDPGAGYAYPPFVFLHNRFMDPYGCALPSATVGILLVANGGSYTANGTVCTTDQVGIFCATTGKKFTCKFTD